MTVKPAMRRWSQRPIYRPDFFLLIAPHHWAQWAINCAYQWSIGKWSLDSTLALSYASWLLRCNTRIHTNCETGNSHPLSLPRGRKQENRRRPRIWRTCNYCCEGQTANALPERRQDRKKVFFGNAITQLLERSSGGLKLYLSLGTAMHNFVEPTAWYLQLEARLNYLCR